MNAVLSKDSIETGSSADQQELPLQKAVNGVYVYPVGLTLSSYDWQQTLLRQHVVFDKLALHVLAKEEPGKKTDKHRIVIQCAEDRNTQGTAMNLSREASEPQGLLDATIETAYELASLLRPSDLNRLGLEWIIVCHPPVMVGDEPLCLLVRKYGDAIQIGACSVGEGIDWSSKSGAYAFLEVLPPN